ncbi:MAG: PAS domain S-box protein [Syntrophales bacterium]|nr:PAS domain S-box protein [Syntrophales bacterium]MDY0044810.1 PAS domain S-box protein [Syntrophales bacterium]
MKGRKQTIEEETPACKDRSSSFGMPDLVSYFIADENGIVQSMNSACADLLMIQAEEAPGENFVSCLCDESRGIFCNHMRDILENISEKRQVELKIMRSNGSEITVVCESIAVEGESGRGEEIHSVLFDVNKKESPGKHKDGYTQPVGTSEHENISMDILRSALSESESDAKLVIENAIEAIYLLRESKIIPLNKNLERITGYSREELMSREFTEFIHPDDREMIIDIYRKRRLGKGAPTRYEFRITNSQGNTQWVEVNVVLLNWKGKPSSLTFLSDVTERHELYEKVKRSEMAYRTIFETTGTAMLIIENNMTISLINNKTEELLNFDKAEVEGKKRWTEFVSENDRQKLEYYHNQRRIDQKSAPHEIEFTLIDRSGKRKQIFSTVNFIPDTKQSIVSLQDITMSRMMERRLKERESKYRLLAENVTDLIWTTDMDLRFTYVSPSLKKVLGYDYEDAVGHRAGATLVAGSRDIATRNFRDALEKSLADRKEVDVLIGGIELEQQHKDGHTVWTEDKIVFIKDEKGLPVGLLGVSRDITERKKIEEALRKSEAKYRELVQSANSIIMRLDTDLRITFFNEYAQQFFDFSEEEIVGKHVSGTILSPAESNGSEMEKMLKDIFVHPERYKMTENENVRKNGERVWIAWTHKAIANEKGEIVEILSVGHDMTHRKIVDEALRASREELKRLSERLITVQEEERKKIAHDLHDSIGQTLSVIKYGIETTRNLFENDEAVGLQKLESLVPLIQGGIKELRKISASLWPATLENMGILSTALSILNDFKAQYPAVEVTREFKVTESDIPLRLKIVIYRILQESLNNIAKHSGATKVFVTLTRRKRTLGLFVKDNGCGFEHRRTYGDNSGYKEWGLSIMKERTQLSGGKFILKSRIGSGTAVRATWTLPQIEDV